jgi:hypothetical protein
VAAGSAAATRAFLLAIVFLVSSCAWAKKSPEVLRGRWTATDGPGQILRGTWSAVVTSRKPDAAQGYWNMLSADGQILGAGRWSAKKTGHGWQGIWKARDGAHRPISGTWKADISSPGDGTLAEMLKSTASKIVDGHWQYDDHGGNWWLRGSKLPGYKP